MSTGPEESGEVLKHKKSLSTGERVRRGMLIASLSIFAVVGGKLGYEVSQNDQRSEDQGRRMEAANNKRCISVANSQSVIRYERGRAIVRLVGLSEEQKIVCELKSAESQLKPYDSGSKIGINLPHGSEVEQSSIEVKLPDTGELQDSAEENLSKANNGMTVLDGIERYSMAGGGAIEGTIIGGLGLMIGVAGMRVVVGRLRQ